MKVVDYGVRHARKRIEPMLMDHFREVGNTAVYNLDPDWAKYYAMDDANTGFWLLALDDNDECIGYSFNFVTPHVHYKGQLVCYNDVLYTQPTARGALAGGRLILATESEAVRRGCIGVQYHAKPGTALDRTLAKRLPPFETAYFKPL